VGDWKDAGLQPPIHFGGVRLPELQASVGNRVTFQSELNCDHRPAWAPTAECEPHPSGYGSNCDHASPPAGTDTPLARLVDVSRIALAARIKHGVRLSELLDHIQSLALIEEELLSRRA
jgi:hypothetical protein